MTDKNNWYDFEMDEFDELFDGRADGLEVDIELTGETYLKEIDSISNEFTITIKQNSDEMVIQHNVADNDEDFGRKAFLKKHGDTLKEYFDNEQVKHITNEVTSSVLFNIKPQQPRMSNEEFEVATEYFGATDIEVLKTKMVKQEGNTYNSITTANYQGEKYVLNLEVEKGEGKSADAYTVNMDSLDIDSKKNLAFKEEIESNFNNKVVADNFDKEDIYNKIKDNLETGITSSKMEEKLSKKKKGPSNEIDF